MFTETCMGGDGVGQHELARKNPPLGNATYRLHESGYAGKSRLLIELISRDGDRLKITGTKNQFDLGKS